EGTGPTFEGCRLPDCLVSTSTCWTSGSEYNSSQHFLRRFSAAYVDTVSNPFHVPKGSAPYSNPLG
ncbi:hypothetical protein CFP56_023164, partial [Quercus suber]